MKSDLNNPLSDEQVCRTLVQENLLSAAQAREILKKRDPLKKKLARQAAGQDAGAITIIDIIDSLKIKRPDKPSLTIDEEHVYQALAKAWQVPYKKIDPLKLDLNMVTSIVPHSFARRHLVLPLSIAEFAILQDEHNRRLYSGDITEWGASWMAAVATVSTT